MKICREIWIMKILVLLFIIIGLFVGCETKEKKEELITITGEVIGKHLRPPGGGIFGGPSQLIVYFKTDAGKYYEIHIEALFYELEKGDRIKMVCREGKFYRYLGKSKTSNPIIENETLASWERIEEQ